MMNLRNFVFLVLLAFFYLPQSFAIAQDTTLTFTSEVFEKERQVKVLLPRRYEAESNTAFSVVYILDAQYDEFWHQASGIIDYMVDSYQILPVIAVGIVSDDRGKEFSPPATTLSQHLKEEVFPLIEKNYRVNQNRSVVGHSWGGAYIATTLFSERNELFTSYLGISPSLDFKDGQAFQLADSLLKATPTFPKFLYCSSGDLGYREVRNGNDIKRLDSVISLYPNKQFIWKTNTFEGRGHWSCVIPSLSDGLIQMSQNHFPDQKILSDMTSKPEIPLSQQIETFYQQKEELYGFAYHLSQKYFRFVGDDFKVVGNYQAALSCYQMAIAEDTTYVRAQIAVAQIYEKMEDEQKEKAALKQVLAMLETYKADYDEEFIKDMTDWANERLAKLE